MGRIMTADGRWEDAVVTDRRHPCADCPPNIGHNDPDWKKMASDLHAATMEMATLRDTINSLRSDISVLRYKCEELERKSL